MKRLGKVLKWIGIVAAVAIAILLILNAYFVWTTGRRLESQLLALRAAGDPVQLADLAREPIPPEKNADVFFRRASDDLDAIQKELLVMYPKVGYPSGPDTLSSDEKEKLEKLFAAYPKVMPLLEQAANCPDYDLQVDVTLPPSRFLQPFMDRISRHRLVFRVLRARAAWLLSKGRIEDALAEQVMSLRLARLWRREPMLIGYLMTAACEQTAMFVVNQVMQAGAISPSARASLDGELALHDSMEGYSWAMRSERAFSLSSIREFPGTSFWVMRGFTNDAMSRFIDLYDWYLKRASESYTDALSSRSKSPPPNGGTNFYGALVTLLIPALDAARPPAERTRAMSRCLRVLNALQARSVNGNELVPKLNELGLPHEATIDPFNGEPLHLKKLPEGWIVYSVGPDLKDDGGILDGKIDGITDVGAGPIRKAESPKNR